MGEIGWAEIRERVCKHYGLPLSVVLRRGRGRENARIKRVIAWVGREVGGLTNQEMAMEMAQDPAALSRGLGKLADELAKDAKLRSVVQMLCDGLRKGKRVKKSIRHA